MDFTEANFLYRIMSDFEDEEAAEMPMRMPADAMKYAASRPNGLSAIRDRVLCRAAMSVIVNLSHGVSPGRRSDERAAAATSELCRVARVAFS